MTHESQDGIRRFFAYARERQAILLRRRAGRPGPWTEDGILQQFRFCNVFREDDTTTIWLREHVRERVAPEELLLATVLFRWFNRIRTGEAIFQQKMLDLGTSPGWGTDGLTPWEARESKWASVDEWLSRLGASIRAYCGNGPYVTGSYIIKTPDGYNKLDGVLWCLVRFMTERHPMVGPMGRASDLGYTDVSRMLMTGDGPISAEMLWGWLRQFPYLGDFMSFEVVTDLDQTFRFSDRMTWANPGPGATRGLGRIFHGRHDHYRANQKGVLNGLMRELLTASQDLENWPEGSGHGLVPLDYARGWGDVELAGPWPAWDMRTVEHTLCEFDKYERVRNGEGRPRQVFRHA